MTINVTKYFGYIATLVLLGMSAWQHNAAFAYAAVLSLGFIALEKYLDTKSVVAAKPGLPEETKRLLQDLSARVTTIEYGIKTRGF